MQQVLFIGWWNCYSTREDFAEELKKWDYDPFEVKKKWKNSLWKELWENYQVAILDMPNKNIALYKEWKIQFEKTFSYLIWDQIIIAHSLWTIFVLKYSVHLSASFPGLWGGSFCPCILRHYSD